MILFNAAQLSLSAGVTGEVWIWLGGRPSDPASLLFPDQFLPITLAIAAYVVTNSTLALSGIALAERMSFRGVWAGNFRWAIPNFLALGSLGVLLAALYYSGMGLYGIGLIWVPLVVARYSFKQYVQLRDAHLETIRALASALDAKDPNTRGHSERVARWAVAIARSMHLSDADIEIIEHAGVLHDIGKIAIKDAVLHKAGRLTEEERRLVEAHPAVGASIIQRIPCLRGAVALIRHHHERYDGTGYPEGLSGKSIPLGARILAVADAFDAMSMDRSYHRGLTFEEAISELWEGRGSQFDPEIVEIFVTHVLGAEPRSLGAQAAQAASAGKDLETVSRTAPGAP
ncbi:MAG TPA: HD-GYP domain-containing protein [Limnochordia bacterium]